MGWPGRRRRSALSGGHPARDPGSHAPGHHDPRRDRGRRGGVDPPLVVRGDRGGSASDRRGASPDRNRLPNQGSSLREHIRVGNDNDVFGPRGPSEGEAQLRPNTCRLAGGDNQWFRCAFRRRLRHECAASRVQFRCSFCRCGRVEHSWFPSVLQCCHRRDVRAPRECASQNDCGRVRI